MKKVLQHSGTVYDDFTQGVLKMGGLINEQSIFVADVCRLIQYIRSNPVYVAVTFGEAYRTEEQQEIYVNTGKSKTMNSMHLKRLAIDLNIFVNVENKATLTYDKKVLQPIGDFWESLDPKNQWGGNWKTFQDVPHFQRSIL